MSSELQERAFWERYSAVVKKAWEDDAFKQRLLSDPAAVFAENDLAVPDGLQIKILEDRPDLRHLPLPPRPTAAEGAPKEEAETSLGSWFCCHTWSSEETQHG